MDLIFFTFFCSTSTSILCSEFIGGRMLCSLCFYVKERGRDSNIE